MSWLICLQFPMSSSSIAETHTMQAADPQLCIRMH